MAINIPSSVFNTYNEAVLLFTRTATLVYPEKKEDCPNCIIDNMAGRSRSVSRYQAGGPYPFERGMPCPYCGGCLLYTSPSPRDVEESRMPSSA